MQGRCSIRLYFTPEKIICNLFVSFCTPCASQRWRTSSRQCFMTSDNKISSVRATTSQSRLSVFRTFITSPLNENSLQLWGCSSPYKYLHSTQRSLFHVQHIVEQILNIITKLTEPLNYARCTAFVYVKKCLHRIIFQCELYIA